MKIASWNVNSVRARIENAAEWLRSSRPDVVLLQETKCENHVFPKAFIEDLGYNIALYGQKSYTGVAILSKFPLEDITQGLPNFEEDETCRYIEAVIKNVRVASVYVPNGNAVDTDKYRYKLKFMEKLRGHMASLLMYEEAAVIGGDYNVAPDDRDVYDPENWTGKILCSPPERANFQTLLNMGYYDALRLHYSGKGPYTWWDYRHGSWNNNQGLRIDHLLLSPLAVDSVHSSGVDKSVRGMEKASDHAPVWCQFAD